MKRISSFLPRRRSEDFVHYKIIFSITWPAFMELFLSSFFNVASTIMVGRLGPAAISGVGLTAQPFHLLIAIFAAVNVGATTLTSWNIGAGNREKAAFIARQTIVLNIFLGIAATLAGFFLAEPIMNFMNKDPHIVAYASNFMKIICLSIVFQAITMGVTALLRGCGSTGIPMLYNLGANLLNVVLSYLFIYGRLGFPRLEVIGAGIATLAARLLSCIAALSVLFFWKNSPLRISLRDSWTPHGESIKKILHIGLPAAGEQFVIQSGLMIFSRVVAGLGVNAYAAHQIGINVNGMAFSISQAFSVATTSLVGQSVGANNYAMAETYTKIARKLARLITGVVALALIALAPFICSAYTDVQAVIDIAVPIFIFMALIQFVQSVQMCSAGALRGAGDTMYPLYACIFGIWIFRVCVAILFVNVFRWGLMGAWAAFFLDQTGRYLIVTRRFQSGKWKEIKK